MLVNPYIVASFRSQHKKFKSIVFPIVFVDEFVLQIADITALLIIDI